MLVSLGLGLPWAMLSMRGASFAGQKKKKKSPLKLLVKLCV